VTLLPERECPPARVAQKVIDASGAAQKVIDASGAAQKVIDASGGIVDGIDRLSSGNEGSKCVESQTLQRVHGGTRLFPCPRDI